MLAIEHHAPSDPLFGKLSLDEVQLVPQMVGALTCDAAAELVRCYPDTRFRLHANVRVLPEHRLADLSNVAQERAWFQQAARVSRTLGAKVYTAHAGRRANASLPEVFDNARRAADLFGCPVGVEGLYPSPHEDWLLSTWAEYGQLLTAGVAFALDLSHLHILAMRSGQCEQGLVKELLASSHCLEVHVSHNDGRRDAHQPCPAVQPWWYCPLDRASSERAHINSFVIFSEGNLRSIEPRLVSSNTSSKDPT